MTTSEDAEELVGLLVDDGVCGGGVGWWGGVAGWKKGGGKERVEKDRH